MNLQTSVLDQTREIASWLDGADPAAPVPTCPDWVLRDLVEHVGATQRWVTRLVADQISDPMAAFGVGWETAPTDAASWPAWLDEGAKAAVTAVTDAPADATIFDPAVTGNGLSYWTGRLFGEIAVHRIDAAETTGHAYALDPELAAFAIDEWLSNMTSAGWAANVPGFADAMRGTGQTIRWTAADVGQSWTVRRTDAPLDLIRTTGTDHQAGAESGATVTIEGDARELLLIVSRRRPLDQAAACTVTGDRSELEHLIDHMNWVGA